MISESGCIVDPTLVPVGGGREGEGETYPEPTGMNIYQRRNLAKKIARAEGKLRKVKGDGLKYLYLPIEQMKPIAEDAWNRAGIVPDIVHTVIEDVLSPEKRTNQYGSTTWWFHQTIELTIALVNMDDPSDRVTMTFYGEAQDNSDKIINKLYANARKNLFMAEFNFAESPKDDIDHDQRDEPAPRRAPANDPFFSPKKKEEEKDPKSDAKARIAEINKKVRNGEITREDGARQIEAIQKEVSA